MVWDVLQGLLDFESCEVKKFVNYVYQVGVCFYLGYIGSLFDLLVKMFKVGGYGVLGGENMLVKDDGLVCYFII